MKYFLDFGTHGFEGLEEFTEKLNLDNNFNVYCYEPNKTIYDSSRKDKIRLDNYEKKFKTFKHYNFAVLDYNGEITFNEHVGV
jgi:hypothetical protein